MCFTVGISDVCKSNFLSLMDFGEGKLLIRYLVVPLVLSRLLLKDCRPIWDRIVPGSTLGAIGYCSSLGAFS